MDFIKKVWQVGAVFVGTVVGAGFATGKEIVEFFSKFALFGLLGIIFAGGLFIYFGYKIMLVSLEIGAKNYFEYNKWLFGVKLSKWINLFFFAMLIIVTATMLSGGGEVLFLQFQINKRLAMLFVAIFAIAVMFYGLKGLSLVNMLVVPIMIIFNIILSIFVIKFGFVGEQLLITKEINVWQLVVRPFAYVAFNMVMGQTVFVPLANEINDQKIIKYGAILGGSLLTIILLLSHVNLTIFSGFQTKSIPTAAIIKVVAPFLHSLYLLVIFGEIFSSIIGNAYGIERQLISKTNLKSPLIYTFFFLICLIIAQFEYARLLIFFYPLFGYIGIIFLIAILLKRR